MPNMRIFTGRGQVLRPCDLFILEAAPIHGVDDDPIDQIFDFMVRDFSTHALERYSKPSITDAQKEKTTMKLTAARYVGYLLLIFSILLLAVPQAALAQTVPNPETPVQTPSTQDDGPEQGTPKEEPAAEPTQPVVTPPDEVTILESDTPGMVRVSRRIYVAEDSYISSGYPNSNFGSATNLNLGWDNLGPNAMRMVIKFDLSGIPSNAVIHSARLSIYQFAVLPFNDRNMDFKAQYMRQDWSEYGVTWNNANYLGGDQLPFGSIPSFIGYITGDATNMVKAWVSGQHPNYGLLITGDEIPSNNRSRRFYSREEIGFQPFIDVEYDVNCDTTPPTASVEPLPPFQPGLFLVKWSGQDFAPPGCAPSGIANYDVEYRIDGGSWIHWKKQTTSTENHFKNYAPDRSFVEIRARATDHAGNVGSYNGPYATTTIDMSPPLTSMNPLPQFTTSPNFTVSWSGDDRGGSGVQSYSVQFRVDGGPWEMLIENTPQTSYQLTGVQEYSLYEFRVQATDNVGNISPWPANAQTSTTIFFRPVAAVLDFDPAVLKPTAPVTDTFNVLWLGASPPGTTITQYSIYYQYNNGAMKEWKTFPGDQITADFPYKQMGYGDGVFCFNAKATNDQGQTGDFVLPPACIAVDMADAIQPIAYLPIISTAR